MPAKNRLYEVNYSIRSSLTRTTVAEGRLLVPAPNIGIAKEAAGQWIVDKSVYYDDRIDPYYLIHEVERHEGDRTTDVVIELE